MPRKMYLAELIATFTLVLFGCGAMVVNDIYSNLGGLGVCTVWGLVVMVMIYSFGNVSGAHMNPAVTLGFLLARRIQFDWAWRYIVCQIFGAILAALLLGYLYPQHETLGSTLPGVSHDRVFVIEMIQTFLLMLVVLSMSTGHMEKGVMAGAAIGALIGLEAMVGGPATGASMNPARSLGPALVSGQFEGLWIYIVAPITGALLAWPATRWIQAEDLENENVQAGDSE
jgi:MIP family channel proteins